MPTQIYGKMRNTTSDISDNAQQFKVVKTRLGARC